MRDTIQNHSRSFRSKSRRAGMTVLLILPVSFALSGTVHHAAQAQTGTAVTCGAALDALMSEWQSIGFVEPSKPAQQVVSGRHGYNTTGGQFNYMRGQIRSAARDCEGGRDADALQHINAVHGILERLGRI